MLYAAVRNEPWRVLAFAIDARDGHAHALGDAARAEHGAHRRGRVRALAVQRLPWRQPDHAEPLAADGRPSRPAGSSHAASARDARTIDNRFAYATSLGGDQLLQFAFDAERGADAAGPARPSRRPARVRAILAFHPNGRLAWLLNELDATLDVLAVAPPAAS